MTHNLDATPPKAYGKDTTIAHLLDTSTSTVWRLVRRGVIPRPIKINGISRFDIAKTIEAFRGAGMDQQNATGRAQTRDSGGTRVIWEGEK
jgi:hypothetical protein